MTAVIRTAAVGLVLILLGGCASAEPVRVAPSPSPSRVSTIAACTSRFTSEAKAAMHVAATSAEFHQAMTDMGVGAWPECSELTQQEKDEVSSRVQVLVAPDLLEASMRWPDAGDGAS